MSAHRTPKNVAVHNLYRRGYRLYNRLFGNFIIVDHDKGHRKIEPLPHGPHNDLPHVGVVVLEGWISA